MKNIQSVCICGGGSLGLVCAGVFLSRGIKVSILTGHPDNWNVHIKVYDPKGKEYSGTLSKISSNADDVIPGCDLVFLTLPGFLIEKTLKDIKPYLASDAIVGSVVSSTGFFFFAHEIFEDKQCLFGFQRVPYIARQRKYGEVGDLLGYKPSLNIFIENSPDTEALRLNLEHIFGTPIRQLKNLYEVSLTNSNPILHTGRLYSMWKDYNGELFQNPSLFYADWTDDASELLIHMDEEFQMLLTKLGVENGVILSLLEYYESKDATSLTNKIKSIQAFQSIKSPMKQIGKGWIPDFSSRYFTEDFPFGLRFIKELAEKNGVKTPVINEVYRWGKQKFDNFTDKCNL